MGSLRPPSRRVSPCIPPRCPRARPRTLGPRERPRTHSRVLDVSGAVVTRRRQHGDEPRRSQPREPPRPLCCAEVNRAARGRLPVAAAGAALLIARDPLVISSIVTLPRLREPPPPGGPWAEGSRGASPRASARVSQAEGGKPSDFARPRFDRRSPPRKRTSVGRARRGRMCAARAERGRKDSGGSLPRTGTRPGSPRGGRTRRTCARRVASPRVALPMLRLSPSFRLGPPLVTIIPRLSRLARQKVAHSRDGDSKARPPAGVKPRRCAPRRRKRGRAVELLSQAGEQPRAAASRRPRAATLAPPRSRERATRRRLVDRTSAGSPPPWRRRDAARKRSGFPNPPETPAARTPTASVPLSPQRVGARRRAARGARNALPRRCGPSAAYSPSGGLSLHDASRWSRAARQGAHPRRSRTRAGPSPQAPAAAVGPRAPPAASRAWTRVFFHLRDALIVPAPFPSMCPRRKPGSGRGFFTCDVALLPRQFHIAARTEGFRRRRHRGRFFRPVAARSGSQTLPSQGSRPEPRGARCSDLIAASCPSRVDVRAPRRSVRPARPAELGAARRSRVSRGSRPAAELKNGHPSTTSGRARGQDLSRRPEHFLGCRYVHREESPAGGASELFADKTSRRRGTSAKTRCRVQNRENAGAESTQPGKVEFLSRTAQRRLKKSRPSSTRKNTARDVPWR